MWILIVTLVAGSAHAMAPLKGPKLDAAMLSARVCHLRSLRQDLLAEIATQKKYSRLGGVEDLSRLNDLQEQIRSLDERVQSDLDDIAKLKEKPLACSAKLMRALLYCEEHNDDACDTNPTLDKVQRYVEQFDSEYEIP